MSPNRPHDMAHPVDPEWQMGEHPGWHAALRWAHRNLATDDFGLGTIALCRRMDARIMREVAQRRAELGLSA